MSAFKIRVFRLRLSDGFFDDFRRAFGSEFEALVFGVEADFDDVSFADVSTEEVLGEWIFDVLLDGAAHWAGSVGRVVTLLHEELNGAGIQADVDVPFFEAGDDFADFEIDDLSELGFLQHAEDDEVVEAVEELGLEVFLSSLGDLLFDGTIVGLILTHGGKA